jgi:hypothetical protein
MPPYCPASRTSITLRTSCCGFVNLSIPLDKKILMPPSLDGKENPVEKEGEQGEKRRLRERKTAGGKRLCKIRKNERDDGKGNDDCQVSDGSLEVIGLLMNGVARPREDKGR